MSSRPFAKHRRWWRGPQLRNDVLNIDSGKDFPSLFTRSVPPSTLSPFVAYLYIHKYIQGTRELTAWTAVATVYSPPLVPRQWP